MHAFPGGDQEGEGLSAAQPLLDYAAGPRRRSPARWRRVARGLLKYFGFALAVATPLAAVYISHRWPWIWYGSRGNFELHRMRTFAMPANRVVYEEDWGRTAPLLGSPPERAGRDVDDPDWAADSDYMWSPGGGTQIWYSPAFVRTRQWVPYDGALVFMHARTGPTGVRRVVWVEAKRSTRARGSSGVGLAVYWHEADWPFFRSDSSKRCMFRGMAIPAAEDARVRLFAGQADADDPARFTIRYQVDNVPGTIEGRLGADGTVTMRVLDGPAAATTQPVGMSGPGRPN